MTVKEKKSKALAAYFNESNNSDMIVLMVVGFVHTSLCRNITHLCSERFWPLSA